MLDPGNAAADVPGVAPWPLVLLLLKPPPLAIRPGWLGSLLLGSEELPLLPVGAPALAVRPGSLGLLLLLTLEELPLLLLATPGECPPMLRPLLSRAETLPLLLLSYWVMPMGRELGELPPLLPAVAGLLCTLCSCSRPVVLEPAVLLVAAERTSSYASGSLLSTPVSPPVPCACPLTVPPTLLLLGEAGLLWATPFEPMLECLLPEGEGACAQGCCTCAKVLLLLLLLLLGGSVILREDHTWDARRRGVAGPSCLPLSLPLLLQPVRANRAQPLGHMRIGSQPPSAVQGRLRAPDGRMHALQVRRLEHARQDVSPLCPLFHHQHCLPLRLPQACRALLTGGLLTVLCISRS